MECIEFIVFGHVQGVGFRYFTRKKANELSIHGWVQNEGDGTVKIMASGSQNDLLKFTEWCHHGPDTSRVDKLVYEKKDYEAFDGFVIKR
ncbi:MAG: acylphosphatase [Saprospiraceae bacterium]|nr:acylphosphatase [Bacteroidia bacterium]MBT8230516.1 acylphosphatase [Bacteroidia bacterium]NNF21095.1 acylphosphatase [Saprospiraceae bacterium]NNK89905.1 acylphosphatase [Saprospiraceae bacterium]